MASDAFIKLGGVEVHNCINVEADAGQERAQVECKDTFELGTKGEMTRRCKFWVGQSH